MRVLPACGDDELVQYRGAGGECEEDIQGCRCAANGARGCSSAHTVKSRSSSVRLLSSSRKSCFKSLSDMHCDAPKLMLLQSHGQQHGQKREVVAAREVRENLGLNDKNPLPSSSALVNEMSSCSKFARTAYTELRAV
jgi:hypothetical protein